jgi:hypothetical protein
MYLETVDGWLKRSEMLSLCVLYICTGPRVTADGSSLRFLYLQHADDNLKMDSSHATYVLSLLLSRNVSRS